MVHRSRIKTHIIARHEKKSSFDVKNQPKCINVIVPNYTTTVARQQVSLLGLISEVAKSVEKQNDMANARTVEGASGSVVKAALQC